MAVPAIRLWCVLALWWQSSSVVSYEIGAVDITSLSPQGLRISVPYEQGAALFSLGYSVNKPCSGPNDRCDWYFDLLHHSYRTWTHQNSDITLRPGDTLNYWLLVVLHGQRYTREGQSWTVPGGPRPPTVTASPTDATIGQGYEFLINISENDQPIDEEACLEYPCLIMREEFDSLDFGRWKHDITASGAHFGSFQYFTNSRTNSYVRDGVLYIKPTLTNDHFGEAVLTSGILDLRGTSPASTCTSGFNDGCYRRGSMTSVLNPVQSAHINTHGTFNFKYGYVEVEAKMPKGDWIWPGISLLPKREEYGEWPTSGQITMARSRGNRDLSNGDGQHRGCRTVESALHFAPHPRVNVSRTSAYSALGDYSDIFHKYGLEWASDHIRLSVDDQTLLDLRPEDAGFWGLAAFGDTLPANMNVWASGGRVAPFDKEFYISLDVSVGSTREGFPAEWTHTAYPRPWANISQQQAMHEFWQAKDLWYPTWHPEQDSGEQAALKVNYIRVWKLDG